MLTKVVNIRKEKCDIYVGRPTIFGNPFSSKEGTLANFKTNSRSESISKFEIYFRERMDSDQEFRNQAMKLKGKILGCFCVPKSCHATIMAKIIDEISLELF